MEIRDRQVAEFMLAVDGGDVARLRSIVEQGLPVDVEDGSGQTGLMKTWNMPVVNVLLEAGADVHRRDRDGWTALHHACRDRRVDKMQRLLHAGADLFLANESGRCPLGLFLETGWYKIAVDLLEEFYPDIDLSVLQAKVGDPGLPWKLALKGFGRTESEMGRGRSLLKAIEEGSLSRVEVILSDGPIVELTDPYERTPVSVAVNSRRCDPPSLSRGSESFLVGALSRANRRR
jgi:ankyrin repeat protein